MLAKIQHALSNFVSLLVLSLRLNLQVENIIHASSAQRSIRFAVSHSLIDFVSPISGSVNSYMWLFSRQVLTAAEHWLLIQCTSAWKMKKNKTKNKNPKNPRIWYRVFVICINVCTCAYTQIPKFLLGWENIPLETETLRKYIIILTGFWPWALFFISSKCFLWVWKAEVN